MNFFDHRLVRHFLAEIKTIGVILAIRNLLTALDLQPIVVSGSLPKNGPTLVISNHVGGLDSFILISQMLRTDFRFVAIAGYQVFGHKLTCHLLPVYHINQWNTNFWEYPRDLLGHSPTLNLTRDQVQKLNQKTIAEAARYVSAGGLVSIFPAGKYGRKHQGTHWKIGLGFLVSQIKNPKTQVVFVKIQGTASHDFLRFLSTFWRQLFFRPKKIKLYFSPAQTLFELVKPSDKPLSIVKNLESHNQSFIDSITDRH